MKALCPLGCGDKFGRIVCTVADMQPCTYQRYCTMSHEWQNAGKFSTCPKRVENDARLSNENNSEK